MVVENLSLTSIQTLIAAIILNEIPNDVKEVFLTRATSKLGRAIAFYLCQRRVCPGKFFEKIIIKIKFSTLEQKISSKSLGEYKIEISGYMQSLLVTIPLFETHNKKISYTYIMSSYLLEGYLIIAQD